MRTPKLAPSILLLVILGSGCSTPTAEAVERSTTPVSSVAGNCPATVGPMRPVGPDAAVDHNRDGYACTRRGISIGGEGLFFEVDNEASSQEGAPERDPVWDTLYTGM